MRLFKVCIPAGEDQFFADRAEAKRLRELTKGATLHRGPDHWRGETDGTSIQMEPQGDKHK